MIRKATINDAEFILSLEKKYITIPWTMENILYSINDKNTLFLIMEDREKIGYVSALLTFDEAEINNITIDLPFRHYGNGKKLLNELLSLLKENNIKKVFLEVSQHNTSAYKLYKENGFIQYLVRKNYYKMGDDAICMEKNL